MSTRIYSATIDNTDRAIARLLEKLKRVDSPENTLIAYSSDNGSYRADRVGHLRGTKGSNLEGGLRVPGIFHWPGAIRDGHIEREPAGLVDLLPTICGLRNCRRNRRSGIRNRRNSRFTTKLKSRFDPTRRNQDLHPDEIARSVASRRPPTAFIAPRSRTASVW